MKNVVLIILLIVLAGELSYLYSVNQKKTSTNVLALKIENTPTPSPTESPTPTLQPTPTLKPTMRPTATPVPQPVFTSQQIYEFIERFAGQYAVDNDVVRHVAICESGFRQFAVNGQYAGLFQFDKSTWMNMRKKMGEDPDPDLRFHAEEAIQTAAYALSIGQGRRWPGCLP